MYQLNEEEKAIARKQYIACKLPALLKFKEKLDFVITERIEQGEEK